MRGYAAARCRDASSAHALQLRLLRRSVRIKMQQRWVSSKHITTIISVFRQNMAVFNSSVKGLSSCWTKNHNDKNRRYIFVSLKCRPTASVLKFLKKYKNMSRRTIFCDNLCVTLYISLQLIYFYLKLETLKYEFIIVVVS